MKKILFAAFALTFLFNLSQSLACEGQDHAETQPVNQSPVKKGK